MKSARNAFLKLHFMGRGYFDDAPITSVTFEVGSEGCTIN